MRKKGEDGAEAAGSKEEGVGISDHQGGIGRPGKGNGDTFSEEGGREGGGRAVGKARGGEWRMGVGTSNGRTGTRFRSRNIFNRDH